MRTKEIQFDGKTYICRIVDSIDGEELQKRISSEIESLKYNYREWLLAEPGSSDSENCYINYRANVAVLGELFRLQGLDPVEAQMVINYVKDLAEHDTIRFRNQLP